MKLIDFEKFLLDNEFNRHISVYGKGKNKFTFGQENEPYSIYTSYWNFYYKDIRVCMDGNICYISKKRNRVDVFFFCQLPGWQQPIEHYNDVPESIVNFLINKEFKKKQPVFVKPKSRYIPDIIKGLVRARYNYKCNYCGCTENLHIDHVHPYSKGGGNNIENLQLLCQPCNSKKSAKLIDEVYKIFDAINPKRP